MSKNADEYMKESDKLLASKKASSEQHKVFYYIKRAAAFVVFVVVPCGGLIAVAQCSCHAPHANCTFYVLS